MFSGFSGFADGIYSTLWGDSLGGGLSGLLSRTPWNYNLMMSGYWLAIGPALLVIVGAAIAILRFVRRISAQWFLLLGFSAALFVALIFMTLKVPSYAQVKAFYGLAALVPFCAFTALGWQALSGRSRVLQFLISAFLIFFSINSFASVWIRPTSELHIYNALRLITQSQPGPAVSEATAAVGSDPSNTAAAYILAAVLDETGDSNKAIAECERCLQLAPNNGDCHFQLGVSLAGQGDLVRAISAANRARDLLTENARVHDLLFRLTRELHHGADALVVGRDAIAVSPFDSDLHYRVGLAAGEIGDLTTATQQLAYALLLNPRRPDYEQKLRVALSFLAQRHDADDTIRVLQPLATGSPKLLEILAAYRQDPSSTQQHSRP
jgi:Flp pilus assembly protein TadD